MNAQNPNDESRVSTGLHQGRTKRTNPRGLAENAVATDLSTSASSYGATALAALSLCRSGPESDGGGAGADPRRLWACR